MKYELSEFIWNNFGIILSQMDDNIGKNTLLYKQCEKLLTVKYLSYKYINTIYDI